MVWIRNVKRILAVHEGKGRKKETLLSERKERRSLWNLLSRVPLGGGGGSASLYLLAARGRTSIIFLAAIVMRLGEIPGGRRGWTSTEKNFPNLARLMLAGRGITARLVPWSERRLIIFFAPTNLRALSLSFFFSLFRKYAHSSSLWSLCDQGYSLSFLSFPFPFLLPYLWRILFQVGLYIIS